MTHLPQYIMVALIGAGVFIDIAKHGEKYEKEHDARIALVEAALMIGLLCWGGFFSR